MRWQELNRPRKQSAYHLYRNGERGDTHCTRRPGSTSAVEAARLTTLDGQASGLFFSIPEPSSTSCPITALRTTNRRRTSARMLRRLPLGMSLRLELERKGQAGDDTYAGGRSPRMNDPAVEQ